MNPRSVIQLAALAVCFSCTSGGDRSGPYRAVKGAWVYSIAQHADSLYFSTLESGIFRFHPDRPGAVQRVAGYRRMPFRTLCFDEKSRLLASSYYAGVFAAAADTMVPVRWAQRPAWAMRLDEQNRMWLACDQGVFRQRGDSLVRFCSVWDAHDVAFFHGRVAVASMRGISLYESETGSLVKQYAPGLVCWSVTSYDSLLIGGGVERCLVISRKGCREIRFGPHGNILWGTALRNDTLHLATQRGVYQAGLSDTIANLAGFNNICVKSVFVDAKGRLWAACFAKPARW